VRAMAFSGRRRFSQEWASNPSQGGLGLSPAVPTHPTLGFALGWDKRGQGCVYACTHSPAPSVSDDDVSRPAHECHPGRRSNGFVWVPAPVERRFATPQAARGSAHLQRGHFNIQSCAHALVEAAKLNPRLTSEGWHAAAMAGDPAQPGSSRAGPHGSQTTRHQPHPEGSHPRSPPVSSTSSAAGPRSHRR
jgi:hypothetical protein